MSTSLNNQEYIIDKSFFASIPPVEEQSPFPPQPNINKPIETIQESDAALSPLSVVGAITQNQLLPTNGGADKFYPRL